MERSQLFSNMDLTEDDGKGNNELPFIPCTRYSGRDRTFDVLETAVGDFSGDGKFARVVSLLLR